GPDSVKAGIDFLRRHRIHVDSSRCPNTIAEFQTWKYKEDKDGNVLEEPVPFKDDAMAALRYATESLRNDNTIRSGRIDW
ncbi:MAG TPA: terminase large subunit, partial [Thermotogota bacterium]|nr:terminase large subunit [Thermotogota bacterium]